jgi:nicotinamide mononucleotide (NMN) deamidase PncC
MVAAAMVAGVGRNGQATTTAIQIARGVDGRQRGERVGLGWVGLTDPDPSMAVLAEPGGPAGLAGHLGQQARWAKKGLLAN